MRRKYDWEEWFGRPVTVLLRGVDYHCSQSAMVQIVRNNAWRRGLRVRVGDTGSGVVIEVRGSVRECGPDAGVGESALPAVRGDVPDVPTPAA